MRILDETSQAIEYSRCLERSRARLGPPLRNCGANERLRELDRLKDDFVSTVTSCARRLPRSPFSEIPLDNPVRAAATTEFLQSSLPRASGLRG
jgi:hypothetical protein